jgi:hypothetical protein
MKIMTTLLHGEDVNKPYAVRFRVTVHWNPVIVKDEDGPSEYRNITSIVAEQGMLVLNRDTSNVEMILIPIGHFLSADIVEEP